MSQSTRRHDDSSVWEYSIEALSDFGGIRVKQGPFLGKEEGKEFFAEANNND